SHGSHHRGIGRQPFIDRRLGITGDLKGFRGRGGGGFDGIGGSEAHVGGDSVSGWWDVERLSRESIAGTYAFHSRKILKSGLGFARPAWPGSTAHFLAATLEVMDAMTCDA